MFLENIWEPSARIEQSEKWQLLHLTLDFEPQIHQIHPIPRFFQLISNRVLHRVSQKLRPMSLISRSLGTLDTRCSRSREIFATVLVKPPRCLSHLAKLLTPKTPFTIFQHYFKMISTVLGYFHIRNMLEHHLSHHLGIESTSVIFTIELTNPFHI